MVLAEQEDGLKTRLECLQKSFFVLAHTYSYRHELVQVKHKHLEQNKP